MSDSIAPMQELLDEICREGRVESSGSFSVDYAQAAEKMAGFRLSSPYEYVLKLVQAAVASGAGEISITVASNRVVVLWDSVGLTFEQLPELGRFALQPQQHGPLRSLTHLAIGLEALRALQPRSVEIVSWDGATQTGLHFVRTPQGDKALPLAQPLQASSRLQPDRTRITVLGAQRPSLKPSGTAWAGWLTNYESRSLGDYGAEVRSLVDSEYSQVWRRCLFAPIPVVLNGRAVNRPFFGLPKTITSMPSSTRIMNIVHPQEPHQYADVRFVVAKEFEPGLIVGPTGMALSGRDWYACSDFPTRNQDYKFAHPHLAGKDLPRLKVAGVRCAGCHVALARLKSGMFSESLGWLAFIKDGVVLSKAWNPIPSMRDWCLLVNAQNLTTDLSEFGVIQDDPYRQAVANLESIAKVVHKKP